MAKNSSQMTANDGPFLDAWRELESALKETKGGPMGALDFEDRLMKEGREADASELKICRQVRNFLVHEGQGFICATRPMQEFIQGLIKEIRLSGGTVRDAMATPAKYGCLKPDATVQQAASELLSKNKTDLLVLDGKKCLLGLFDGRAAAAALAGQGIHSLQDLADQGLLTKAPTVPDGTPVPQAPAYKRAVVDQKGRCLGVWNPERGWS